MKHHRPGMARVHGIVTALTFLPRAIRSSIVAAIAMVVRMLVCSISTVTVATAAAPAVSAWLCPCFKCDLPKTGTYRRSIASQMQKNEKRIKMVKKTIKRSSKLILELRLCLLVKLSQNLESNDLKKQYE